jgi:hypothetical protein
MPKIIKIVACNGKCPYLGYNEHGRPICNRTYHYETGEMSVIPLPEDWDFTMRIDIPSWCPLEDLKEN